MNPYRETHIHIDDGSPAMLVESRGIRLLLENEDGHQWEDCASDWEPITQPAVSGQKLLTINLLRHKATRRWLSTNFGWVDDIALASVVTDEVYELVHKNTPGYEQYEVVRFTQLPF